MPTVGSPVDKRTSPLSHRQKTSSKRNANKRTLPGNLSSPTGHSDHGDLVPTLPSPGTARRRDSASLTREFEQQAKPPTSQTRRGNVMGEGKSDDDSAEAMTSKQNARDVAARTKLAGTKVREDAAMEGSRKQLNIYREKLARDMERQELSARGLTGAQERSKVSPIQEEDHASLAATCSPTSASLLTTTSTESGKTVRGDRNPMFIAQTPSYPFPRMNSGGHGMGYLHRPFTTLSPTGTPRNAPNQPFSSGVRDTLLSTDSTPASEGMFLQSEYHSRQENLDYPTPNLSDLSLMLAAEPGMDAWWNTVVDLMQKVYRAERVTLSVPADATDIENVPWGQKATYNEHEEDVLSLDYLGRGSSAKTGSEKETTDGTPNHDSGAKAGTPLRPGLWSRHSWTAYEDNRSKSAESEPPITQRPNPMTRSRSHLSTSNVSNVATHTQPWLNQSILRQHEVAVGDQNIPSWEAGATAQRTGQGRILPVLQALDYEADPLIDHIGVMRVLERGKAIALTRNYPYLAKEPVMENNTSSTLGVNRDTSSATKKSKKRRSANASTFSTMLSGSSKARGSTKSRSRGAEKTTKKPSNSEDADAKPATPTYEEFEQGPSSPWSHSPAPSPAIRTDTKENPFFTDATLDEESFNPSATPEHYTDMQPPEAIGVDNSWTVLHIPLCHVLLSKSSHQLRAGASPLEERLAARQRGEPHSRGEAGKLDQSEQDSGSRQNITPIAILSILSPVIPYPSSLRHSLSHLAPHLATSFSLCRHYTNLETELAGLRRRRPSTAGFGAIGPDGRPLTNSTHMTVQELARQQSLGGSITSPSDYSAISKSATASPMGTPSWETGSLNYLADKWQPFASPAALPSVGDSYFNSKQRHSSRPESLRVPGLKSQIQAKDNSPKEKRHHRYSSSKTSNDLVDSKEQFGKETGASLQSRPSSSNLPLDSALSKAAEIASSMARADSEDDHQGHTMLHSYGADFASTFQSLPPSSSLSTRPPTVPMQSRSGSVAASAADMPPPSDRLKGLILDSLPAHVFVALPANGEIVWVNSRFLSYRGQAVADLAMDPWGSIHPDDRNEYLKSWSHSLRTGEQFSRTVRIRRFDGAYRWFHARAVASKDKRGVIMQFLGSYMDIHDQHIAELKAARQEEIEASEAKHRLLANLIPQIIFTATEEDGITFANEQWLSYTGQHFQDSLGLGFMDHVHPEDLAKCKLPSEQHSATPKQKSDHDKKHRRSATSPDATPAPGSQPTAANALRDGGALSGNLALSRNNSSDSSSVHELLVADLSELARKGIIKVTTDTSGRLSYTTEVRLRSKTGEYRWHLIRCVEIDTIDFGSGASSYFGSATDINDHKLLEAKLKEAMESKSRFLSNMSHEIRTPLIGISGMVSFLQDTILNEEQRDYTNTIQTSANSLIMIINDILDLSKVDAGMMKLKHEWFHTRSLIEDVNELLFTMAVAKRLELNYLVEANVPAWVKGDKVRVRQVLLNVIGNAIKFTNEGEVFSHCKVSAKENSLTQEHEIVLEFAVTDTGRGFSDEEAALIFKPFSQIDGSSTRQHGGSGLGLVISRQLVELHGGKMVGTAVPGKGSTFTFTARFSLPTKADHPKLPNNLPLEIPVAPRQDSSESIREQFKAVSSPKQLENLYGTPASSAGDTDIVSPGVVSTSSSNPSGYSIRSQITDKSSTTSVNTGLARFSEAAKASGQDLSLMRLEMPSGRSSPGRPIVPSHARHASIDDIQPPIYSILVICPQHHSREATKAHIQMTLPKNVPHEITTRATTGEALTLVAGEDSIKLTHIVINLPSAEGILNLIAQIKRSRNIDDMVILVLLDSVQRQAATKLAIERDQTRLFNDGAVTFIYKPVKPSRFAVIFDPNKMQDLSTDRNRSSAQQMVDSQKASYLEIEKLMGNKGHKVLLVEDNMVNQKVLTKYLEKIGVNVEIAVDGVECLDMVLSKPHKHYSLILVSSPPIH